MTGQEFLKGWAILSAQPYGKDYTYDKAKEAIQRGLYSSKLKYLPDGQWLAVVDWWVQHESRWPLLSDINAHLTRMFPPSKPEPLTAKALLAAPMNPSCEPWQGIVRAWIRGDGSIFEVGLPILRKWHTVHPQDKDVAETLAHWEQQLGVQQAAA